MRRTIAGSRVIVTGATSGIGYETALALARQGARVLATGRRQERLESLQSSFDGRSKSGEGSIDLIAGDIIDPSFRSQLIERSQSLWGGLDGLVNNAGVGAIGRFEHATPERLRKVMEVDFFSAVELTRAALPSLRSGICSYIAIVGSVLGHRAVPLKSEYCAAKFAIRGWSEALRVELKSQNIDVLMISPSTTRSEFFESLVDTDSTTESKSIGAMSTSAVAEHVLKSIRLGRRDHILSIGGKSLVFFSWLFPKTFDRFLERWGM